MNLPDYKSTWSTPTEKEIYLAWRDLQYAIHSSLTTPYGYRTFENEKKEKIQRPKGILNHLFKMKNKKKYEPYSIDPKFSDKSQLMNQLYK